MSESQRSPIVWTFLQFIKKKFISCPAARPPEVAACKWVNVVISRIDMLSRVLMLSGRRANEIVIICNCILVKIETSHLNQLL